MRKVACDIPTLQRYLDGGLSCLGRRNVESHLVACDACRELITAGARCESSANVPTDAEAAEQVGAVKRMMDMDLDRDVKEQYFKVGFYQTMFWLCMVVLVLFATVTNHYRTVAKQLEAKLAEKQSTPRPLRRLPVETIHVDGVPAIRLYESEGGPLEVDRVIFKFGDEWRGEYRVTTPGKEMIITVK